MTVDLSRRSSPKTLATDAPSYLSILAFATVSKAVARLPLERIDALVERRAREGHRPRGDVEAVARRVEQVLGHTRILRHTCLSRGLTRYFFLRRAGADVRLVFGLGQIDGAYAGHCWILRDGTVYQEATDPALEFADVVTLPLR